MFEQARQDASDPSVIGWASILHIDNKLGLAGLILGPYHKPGKAIARTTASSGLVNPKAFPDRTTR